MIIESSALKEKGVNKIYTLEIEVLIWHKFALNFFKNFLFNYKIKIYFNKKNFNK